MSSDGKGRRNGDRRPRIALRLSLNVLATVLAVSLLNFVGRYLYLTGLAGPGVWELLTMLAFLTLSVLTFAALRSAYALPIIGRAFLAGMLIVLVVEVSRVADAFIYPEQYPVSHSALFSTVREGAFAVGIGLFMASFYFCIFEAARTKEDLRCLNAELEARVRERTAELSRVNEQLHKEIAERKEAERRLTEALSANETLIAASPIGILAYRASGLCVLANEAAARLTGGTVPQMLMQSFREIATWRDSGLLALAEATLASGERRSERMHLTTTFGKEIWSDFSLTPFVSGGENHLLLMAEDVAERVRAERLIADQQLRMINAARMSALGLMAGGIAHEINNPLAIISVGAQQLESLLRGPAMDMDRILKVGETITRNVSRVHRIVRALRSLTREGSGDPFVETSLREILADSLELCQERFKRHGITLTVPAIPPEVELECRASQLSQVVLNLLNNACDAVETSDDKWIRLDFECQNGDVVLTVANGGPKLSDNIADKVFIPFFTTKPEGKGIGLGLSISKSIVEDHRGILEIDPVSPHTCFIIRVPMCRNLTG